MSEHAGVYYAEQAEQLGLSAIPDILRGHPLELAPGSVLPAHGFTPSQITRVGGQLSEAMGSTAAFVLAGMPPTLGLEFGDIAGQAGLNRRRLAKVRETLLPGSGKMTGSLSRLSVEAIAPSEVDQSRFAHTTESKATTMPQDVAKILGQEVCQACFIVSARHKTSRGTEPVAALYVARATMTAPQHNIDAAPSEPTYAFVRYASRNINPDAINGYLRSPAFN